MNTSTSSDFQRSLRDDSIEERSYVVAVRRGKHTHMCHCCGSTPKLSGGGLENEERIIAIYLLEWTVAQPSHVPMLDLIMGPWGDAADPASRMLASLSYSASTAGGQFNVIDSVSRPANIPNVCGRALTRNEILGTTKAAELSWLLESLTRTEPLIAEFRALDKMVAPSVGDAKW